MTDRTAPVSDPTLSLFQSAVAEVAGKIGGRPLESTSRRLQKSASSDLNETAADLALREYKLAIGEPSPERSPLTRELQPTGIARVCAELALRYMKALASGDREARASVEDEFKKGTCDPEWITTLTAYASYFDEDGKRKPIPYIRAESVGAQTYEIKANAHIAIVGDWGTGARPAIEVLKSIADEKPDVLVHLGDIYYSGTRHESEKNFLELIETELRSRSTAHVYTLSGNHDMYCGGVGYYDLIGRLNAAPNTQSASFFCLRSADERWQLLAMDTGLHDDNPAGVTDALTYLEEDELAWHCARIGEFGGQTILLSHHQPFSAFSSIGPRPQNSARKAANPHLMRAFTQMSDAGRIAAWFWGHEHALGIYEPFAGIAVGRCLGHGAVPVSVEDPIYNPLPDLEDPPRLIEGTQLGSNGGVFAHGYAMLELRGTACEARYNQLVGNHSREIFRESISSR